MYWEPEPSPSSKPSYKNLEKLNNLYYEVETAEPVILRHLSVGPIDNLRKFCTEEPMDWDNTENYPNIPRKVCPDCYRLFINSLRRDN